MSLISASAALAVALVLLAAAAGHLRDARGTRAALAAHDVLPSGLQRAVVLLLPPVELLLGAGLLLALLGSSPLLTVVAGAATGLLAGFAAYLLVVLRRTRGRAEVPCGCGLGAAPVGWWAVLRALVLAGLALTATLGGVPVWGSLPTDQAPLPAQLLVVAAAGLTLAVVTAALPAARAVPAGLTTLQPVGGGGR